MRFERTEIFKADYKRLSVAEQETFRKAAREFSAACDDFIRRTDPFQWPGHLRIKPVTNAPGVFELTWSFSGPDGRATWEWVSITDDQGNGYPAIRWRRLGSHRIFRNP